MFLRYANSPDFELIIQIKRLSQKGSLFLCNKRIRDSFREQIERNVNTQYPYDTGETKLKTEYTAFAQKPQLEIKRITEYVDNFQYENRVLQFSANEEGYYDFVQNRYIYTYKDHLGNMRLSYYKQTDGTAKVLEENNYYPFGLRHTGYYPLTESTYRYKYNGKEVQENGMYDYGARFYMPDIGRWGVADPMAEVTPHLSPYHYANNNPIMYNDPTGMLSQSFIDQIHGSSSGTTWYNTGSGFSSNGGNSMDYDGNSINWSGSYTSNLLASVGISYGGGGGGDVAGEARLPLLWINSPSNISWAWQAQANQQYFVERMNSYQAAVEWEQNRYRGPEPGGGSLMMMNGDMFGFTDLAAVGLSRMEPKNRYAAMALGIVGGIALKKPGLITKTESNILRHYTTEAGYKAIMESGELLPSIGIKNARYGSGQYLTDLMSHQFTAGQASRRLFGVPWNSKKMSHFIELDVSGLNVIKNGPNNFLVPGNGSLPIQGIIVNHGAAIFK